MMLKYKDERAGECALTLNGQQGTKLLAGPEKPPSSSSKSTETALCQTLRPSGLDGDTPRAVSRLDGVDDLIGRGIYNRNVVG